MTEITRVPLQPIKKGTLTKLWLGVILVLLIGAGIAWASVPEGIELDTLRAGTGPHPGPDDVVFVHYTGRLEDGRVFDQSRDLPVPMKGILPDGFPMLVSQNIPGFTQGLQQMQKGGKYRLEIPAKLAYGASPPPSSPPNAPIPPNADLVFDVELVDFMSQEDANRRLQVLQQMMQMQQQQQGAPGSVPAPEGATPPLRPAPPPPAPQPQ